MSGDTRFLPGVDAAYCLGRLARAGGAEIESGKFASRESSAALAANCFGWFAARPAMLPAFPGLDAQWPADSVDIEYQARFPWTGGRHPWLDAAILTPTHLIGVESKRFEPFRDRKAAALSDAYDRPVWGAAMAPWERMRDDLRAGRAAFVHLDAAQLVKHAFGLYAEGRRAGRKPALVYLHAEPAMLGGKPIGAAALSRHRAEIAAFAAAVSGAGVAFAAVSYRDWIAGWPDDAEVQGHGAALTAAFQP